MEPDIQWITPMFGFDADCTHIATHESARQKLDELVQDLLGTSGLVAVYIPESTDDAWDPGGQRGRVIGAVKLLPMPRNRSMEDYSYRDLDGSDRWPIGWPCRAVYAPDEAECPTLREHVEHMFPGAFGGYVSRFQNGPFRLEDWMRERLNRDFEDFDRLD